MPVSDLLAAGLTIADLFEAGIMVGSLEQAGIDSLTLADAGLIGELFDVENNKYKWLKINDQVWMAENLRTTRYPDGSAIPLVAASEEWSDLDFMDDAYCQLYFGNPGLLRNYQYKKSGFLVRCIND